MRDGFSQQCVLHGSRTRAGCIFLKISQPMCVRYLQFHKQGDILRTSLCSISILEMNHLRSSAWRIILPTIRLLDSLELPPPHYRISSTEWHATHSCMKTRTLESVLESRFMMSDRLWPDFSHQSRVKQRHSGAVSPFRMQSGRNIMSPKVLMHVIIQ